MRFASRLKLELYMKLNFRLLKYLLILPIVLLSCAKESNKNNQAYQQPQTYYMSNGQCYSSNGQVVNASLCQSYGQSGYYMANGQCYTSTGQVANLTLCQNTTGGLGTLACNGVYYYQSGYSWQAVYCNGTNCSGYTLYSQQGQPVRCQ